MYADMAQYYDRIYAFKDYADEVGKIVAIVENEGCTKGRRLLDVACGTGLHLEHFRSMFDIEGIDLCPELLDVAQRRLPDVPFHVGDMRSFALEDRYDIVTCLFSSIGYMTTVEDLRQAIAQMVLHLVPGGLLLVEPWFEPEAWQPNTVHGIYIDDPALKIARINTSFVDGRVSIFDLHHLIGTTEGTRHVIEHHEMGLFTVDEMTAAFAATGVDVRYDPDGLTGRGLYIAKKGS